MMDQDRFEIAASDGAAEPSAGRHEEGTERNPIPGAAPPNLAAETEGPAPNCETQFRARDLTDAIAQRDSLIIALLTRLDETERERASLAALVEESTAAPFGAATQAQRRRTIAQQLVLSDARARITALENELVDKEEDLVSRELDFVRQLARLSRPGRPKALRGRLGFRSFGSFRKAARKLAKDYHTVASSPLFDKDWYLSNNPDAVAKSMDPVLHYLSYGSKQGRSPGPNFDASSYLELNPDIAAAGYDAFLHFLSVGHAEKRPFSSAHMEKNYRHTRAMATNARYRQLDLLHRSKMNLSLAVPFKYISRPDPTLEQPIAEPRPGRRRVAVLAHIFYQELAPEIRTYLENIPGAVDVFVSTTDNKKRAEIEKAFLNWRSGTVDVRIVANRGRDVAPILINFKDVLNSYEIMLHVHSKKSGHADRLFLWRDYLYETLLGDNLTVVSILDAFEHNQNLGMVCAAHFPPIRDGISWGSNFATAQKIAQKIGFSLRKSDPLDFPSGSMFWARSSALRPLLDLNLTVDDFELEDGQIDGTLAHSIERLFFHSCEKAGFIWARIARPEFLLNSLSALAVPEPTYINQYYHSYKLSLLAENIAKPEAEGRTDGARRQV